MVSNEVHGSVFEIVKESDEPLLSGVAGKVSSSARVGLSLSAKKPVRSKKHDTKTMARAVRRTDFNTENPVLLAFIVKLLCMYIFTFVNLPSTIISRSDIVCQIFGWLNCSAVLDEDAGLDIG